HRNQHAGADQRRPRCAHQCRHPDHHRAAPVRAACHPVRPRPAAARPRRETAMKTALTLAALALLLGGCINIGDKSGGPAVVHYVLSDPAAAGAVAPAPERPADVLPTLLVLDTTAGSFYDTEQLVFSRSAGTRGQYQFARWTERPGKRFADLMRARL